MINMRSGNASRGGYRGEYRSDLLFLLQSARRHEQGRQGSMGRSEHLCPISRQVPPSHGFVFSHAYCPVCGAHFHEHMAAYRPTPVWGTG